MLLQQWNIEQGDYRFHAVKRCDLFLNLTDHIERALSKKILIWNKRNKDEAACLISLRHLPKYSEVFVTLQQQRISRRVQTEMANIS